MPNLRKPRTFIPSKYTRYMHTVYDVVVNVLGDVKGEVYML